MRTLVLLSGGLDSAVILANLVKNGNECTAIGFDYFQAHDLELDHAKKIAAFYKVPFSIIQLPELPKSDDVVFVGRNLIFAAMAVACAHELGCGRIAIGCNATDWDRFPDCRPVFWTAVKRAIEDAYGIVVVTPLLHSSKIEIVQMARELEVPIEMTWSCYEPNGDQPCGKCLACTVRKEAIKWSLQPSI